MVFFPPTLLQTTQFPTLLDPHTFFQSPIRIKTSNKHNDDNK